MIKNSNLQLLIEKIFGDEQTLDKVTQARNADELYQICLMIQGGYSREEFLDFFNELIHDCQREVDKTGKLEDSLLQNIAGGKSNFNRIAVSALASLTILTGNHFGAYAQSTVGGDSVLSSNVVLRKAEPGEDEEIRKRTVSEFSKVSKGEPEEKELSWGAKIKKFIVGLFSKKPSKKPSDDFDYGKGAERLELLFEKSIHGQESVKKQLRDFYKVFTEVREDEKNGVATAGQLAPRILFFDGPGGVGKSYIAKLFAQCLTNIDPFIISAGAILKDVEASKAGGRGGIDVNTAFWVGGSKYGGGAYYKSNHKGKSYDNLVSYLSATKGSVRVVILDEYDKLYTSGSRHPLDETFRDILCNSVKNPFIQTPLDLSKTIFICTTNETKASLQGRIVFKDGRLQEKAVDEHGNLIYDENGRQVYIDPTDDDNSGTQTHIPHDPSFMGHLGGSLFHFDALKHEDYIRIVHDALDDDPNVKSLEDLQAIGGIGKIMSRHRIRYGLAGIEMDPEGYELIANYAAGTKSATNAIVGSGWNIVGSVAGNLDAAIIEQIGKWLSNGYSVKNMKIKVIPRLETNSAGVREVKFDVKSLGYID